MTKTQQAAKEISEYTESFKSYKAGEIRTASEDIIERHFQYLIHCARVLCTRINETMGDVPRSVVVLSKELEEEISRHIEEIPAPRVSTSTPLESGQKGTPPVKST